MRELTLGTSSLWVLGIDLLLLGDGTMDTDRIFVTINDYGVFLVPRSNVETRASPASSERAEI